MLDTSDMSDEDPLSCHILTRGPLEPSEKENKALSRQQTFPYEPRSSNPGTCVLELELQFKERIDLMVSRRIVRLLHISKYVAKRPQVTVGKERALKSEDPA